VYEVKVVRKCPLDISAPLKNPRHFGTGAEMSRVRSVLGPKCPYTCRLTTFEDTQSKEQDKCVCS